MVLPEDDCDDAARGNEQPNAHHVAEHIRKAAKMCFVTDLKKKMKTWSSNTTWSYLKHLDLMR